MTSFRLFLSGALAVACAVTVTVTTAIADGGPPPASPSRQAVHTPRIERGTLVSATPVDNLTAVGVAERVRRARIDASDVRFGVTAHRVVYRTVDTEGRPITASQLVALPGTRARALRVVSWLHGTTVHRRQVASMNATSTDRAAALLFASTGYAVSAPDYLGLGVGSGHHPYGHPGATVTASVDALRAARTFVRQSGHRLHRRVLISGFSQGGPATMMVGRALQQGADPYFRLGALAPIAGPFDLNGFEAAAADDRVANAQLYLAYFVTAWDRLYDLYDSPSEAFRAPP